MRVVHLDLESIKNFQMPKLRVKKISQGQKCWSPKRCLTCFLAQKVKRHLQKNLRIVAYILQKNKKWLKILFGTLLDGSKIRFVNCWVDCKSQKKAAYSLQLQPLRFLMRLLAPINQIFLIMSSSSQKRPRRKNVWPHR